MNFARFALARLTAAAIIAALAAVLPDAAMAQNNPLAGTWKYVPEKSNYMPGPARFKDANLSFATSGDPVMTIEGTDAQGKPVKATFAAVPDGKPHPITGFTTFDSGSWTKYNDTVTTYQYNKGKNIAVVGVRALSADGSTLTFQEKTYDNNGKQTGTSVQVFVNPDVKVASASKPATPVAPPVPEPPKPVLNPQEQAAVGKPVCDRQHAQQPDRQEGVGLRRRDGCEALGQRRHDHRQHLRRPHGHQRDAVRRELGPQAPRLRPIGRLRPVWAPSPGAIRLP